jgi:uncharacterized protein GlcG (DUF336 family)
MHKRRNRNMASVNLSHARRILQYGVQLVHDRQLPPVCLSICDANGFLLGFIRMDDAPLRSIEIAQRKAYTSARMGMATRAFHERLTQANLPIGYYGDALFTALPGGAAIPDTDDGIAGGIGISGLAPQEDQALADELAACQAAV